MAGASDEYRFEKTFLEAVVFAFKQCGLAFSPKSEQLDAIYAVVTGKDVFVKAATGFGKSVCFITIPYVCDYLYRCKTEAFSNPSFSSVVLVISPLKALMEDQLQEIAKYGISGKKLHEGLTEDELVDVGEGKFKILISSPESLSERKIRDQLRKLRQKIVCVAIDEAHCVLQWGKEFRTEYRELIKVRAFLMHGVPVMALTGTATLVMVKEITQILGMYEFVTVKATSNRPNIMYTVEKMETVLDEEVEKKEQLMHHIFGEVICDLNNKGKKASKVIVFCFLQNDCAMIYEFFVQKLGNQGLVNMFTNITDDISKKSIVTQFCNSQSELRVVIATVAFGMGINCPDVCKVIHFRSPCTLLNYGQEAGRCGRDGRQAQAKLFYSNKEFGICLSKFNKKQSKYQSEICELQKMKMYAANTAECRRVLLLSYLDGEADAKREIENSKVTRHNCCDICASTCECEDCILIEAMYLMEIEEVSTDIPGSGYRRFTNKQKKVIKTQLIHLRASLSENACLLSPDHTLGFTTHVINQIVENCESLNTEEDVFEKVDVWNASLAQDILTILANVETQFQEPSF